MNNKLRIFLRVLITLLFLAWCWVALCSMYGWFDMRILHRFPNIVVIVPYVWAMLRLRPAHKIEAHKKKKEEGHGIWPL